MTTHPIRRALISVSDKTGLIDLAQALAKHDIALISTGGTAKALRDAGFAVTDVAELTGFPEMMDGRVKTLHPKLHGGILARRDDKTHQAALAQHGIAPIDLVIVNLYPFAATVKKGADFETCVENIDIGGPALIRAAAKNHDHVAVLTDPRQYPRFLNELAAQKGSTTLPFRRTLAAEAYAHTAAYDTAVANWFSGEEGQTYPPRLLLAATLASPLRYGENPHQTAALYVLPDAPPSVATATQVQGKELSYNNINDTDAALALVAEFTEPAVAIIKHANPCGVAIGENLPAAYRRAFACDPVSAFGGIIALNRPLDAETAEAIAQIFTEVIIAPDATEEAKQTLAAKKNLRLLLTGAMPNRDAAGSSLRSIAGGYLLQSADAARVTESDLKIVTRQKPTKAQLADMLFAFTVAKHVKSNAIVYAKDGVTAGIGAGQMSRIDSARIAASKAEDAAKAAGWPAPLTKGSAVASDAFFPFADGLLSAIAAGATSVIQPGGSIRDDEVIKAADAHGITMAFTGIRHFRH